MNVRTGNVTPEQAQTITQAWEDGHTEFQVGEWISFTDGMGHDIEAKVVAKVVKNGVNEYTLQQWPTVPIWFVPDEVVATKSKSKDPMMIQRHQLIDKRIHELVFLHDDGEKSTIRLVPYGDGFALHIDLGKGKVMHDLEIERDTESR